MSTYVLVHGACCFGAMLEGVAELLRNEGHEVHCPTTKGNVPGQYEQASLDDAIQSIIDFLAENDLSDVILTGHSWGGMVITGVADRAPERVRRLIYWNAFVPNDGESLMDLVPPHYVEMFNGLAQASGNNSLAFPPPVLREAFMNYCTSEQVEAGLAAIVPQSFATMNDRISISKNPAAFEMGKSFINSTEDTSLPHSHGWHPRLSEKLGLFRLIQMPGDHMAMVSDPEGAARSLIMAGRD